jgi:hypothetical protein
MVCLWEPAKFYPSRVCRFPLPFPGSDCLPCLVKAELSVLRAEFLVW